MGWIADLLKEIPSAARYKSELEKLESEHSVSQEKIANLEAEKAVLQSKLTAAEEQVRDLQEQLSARRWDRLEPLKERILCLLKTATHFTSYQIAQELQASEDSVDYHLWGMEETGFVAYRGIQDEPNQWYRTQKGSQYLHEHNLL